MKPSARHRSIRDEAIEATAAAWLVERDDGLTPEAAAAFSRWRQADPLNEAAVILLESTWSKLQQLRSFRPEAQMHPDCDLLARPRVERGMHFPTLAATAMVAASLALVVTWWCLRPGSPSSAANESAASAFATVGSGYARTVLSDGSVLELNASSEVRVHFTPGERRVRLVRGEAHFTVTKNKARPFWVEAGTLAVRAVGTEFDVSLRPNSVEVLVTEGRVQVDRPSGPAFVAAVRSSKCLVELGASQRASISLQGVAVRPVVETLSPKVIREEMAWQGARLEFGGTPLAELVEQFNRSNQVQLELGDPTLGAQLVGGSFQTESVEVFVRLLVNEGGIAAERPDANHIILRRAR